MNENRETVSRPLNADISDEDFAKKGIELKKLLLIVGAALGSCLLIAIIVIVCVYNNDEDEEDNPKRKDTSSFIRLKNWEAINSLELPSDMTAEKISTGVFCDKFLKAPKEWNVTTAMGAIVGNSNDIFFGRKMDEVNKTQFDNPWWFRSANFNLSKTEEDLIILHIRGINYKGELWIDGQKVLSDDVLIGTFVRHDIDITNFIKSDINLHTVAFKLDRPHDQVGTHSEHQNDLDLAITFVDWNPNVPDSNLGVWQPVDIEISKKGKLTVKEAFIKTNLNDNATIAKVSLFAHIKNYENKKIENIPIKFELGQSISYETKVSFNENEEKLIKITTEDCPHLLIKKPKLWMPYQVGNQSFYNLAIIINEYVYNKRVALREVLSVNSEDKKSKSYFINRKRIFIKGAGFTPDIFLRYSPEVYKKHLDYVKHMNLNTVRLEGKFEDEEFFNLCDEMGILIMAGWCCCDAWERWDYWKNITKIVANNSLKSQIKRLSSHPSVFVFLIGSDGHPKEEIEKMYLNTLKEEFWPNEFLSSATGTVSSVSGCTGVKMTGPYSWVPPHYFLFDETESYGGAWSLMTEGGPGENPLRKGSYENIFEESDITWPLNESVWSYHCGSKEGQFSSLGKFIEPLEERYGKVKNFEDFQRKSSASVYDSHKAMYEAYNLKRYRSTGLIQWMLNNAWPSNIWHLYDYYFTPTPSYFATKKAFEDILPVYNYYDHYIYLINNLYEEYNHTVEIKCHIISGKTGKIESSQNQTIKSLIKADSTIKLFEVKLPTDLDVYYIHLEIYSDKVFLSSNSYILAKEMDVMNYEKSTFYNVGIESYADLSKLDNIPKANLTVTKWYNILTGNINLEIENSSEIYASLIELRLITKNEGKNIVPVFWTDNYFSMLGKSKISISAQYDPELIKDVPNVEISGWNIPTQIV